MYKKWLLRTLLALMLWGCVHLVILLGVGFFSAPLHSDVLVIFGNTVLPNGQVSPRLQTRLDEGIRLYELGFAPYIVVSGGFGKEGYDEAIVMKQYLISHHISQEVIVVDSHGDNTYQTARNLKILSKTYHFKNVLIVSQYYHLLRAKLALRQAGFAPVSASHARYRFELRDCYSIPREILGWYVYVWYDYQA